jgi:HEAT repeat protein/ATP/ADP translocase
MRFSAELLAVRPGEGRLVALLGGLFATIEAGRGLGEVAADTLFISRFGADALPYLFIGLGMVSLVVALAYGAAIGRLERRRFLVTLLAALAAILLAERIGVLTGARFMLPVLWLSVYAVGAVLLTVVWTIAGTTLNARQAKRLFPICTSAAIVGGFVGTLAAGPTARLMGTENLVVLYAALLVVASALTGAIVRGHARPARMPQGPASLVAELRAGLDYVRQSPLMRLVGVAYVLFAVLLFSVSFPFLRAMGAAFESEADLATALGLLSAAVTGVSFVVSIAIANRLYSRFGVMGAALLLPVVYLVGFGLWLIQFSLSTALAVRFAQQVTQRGVSNAAWSALYTVLPAERRPQVLAFIDGVPGQLGISVSGVLLLVVGALLAPTQIFVMGMLAAVASIWVVLRIRARYGQALVTTLRAGLAEQILEGGPGLAALSREPMVVDELRRALSAPKSGARRLAADLLGHIGTPDAGGDLVRALDDTEADVRVVAIRSLARVHPHRLVANQDRLVMDTSPMVRAELAVALGETDDVASIRAILDPLLDSPKPDDRVAALDALARLGRHGSTDRVAAACADPLIRVRAAAMHALGALARDDHGPPTALVAGLGDDAQVVRQVASAALAGRDDATAVLLDTLRRGSEQAQQAAVAALGAGDETREPIRAWALRLVERAALLRQYAVAASTPSGTLAEFLSFLVAQRERRIEELVLTAIATLGAPAASGPIRRALRSPDSDVRAQAVEALDALGDRQLGRAVSRLMDADHLDEQANDETIRALAEDDDPWISAVAWRVLGERNPDQWPMIVASRAGATDPVARFVLGTTGEISGDTMADTERTLGDVERMLFLRRVALFEQLAPEDLQRIAATATERLYHADDALVHEGDVGDELVVIVEGEVAVIQGRGPEARLIRTYQAGEHIGELAVLRAQPRAASVIAGDAGVRGLVIGGEGLRAILRERPEAAMAMLATLADRISAQ